MTDPNESAFPAQELNGQGCPRSALAWGLSKREYFAAIAMQGLLAAGYRSRDMGLACCDGGTEDQPCGCHGAHLWEDLEPQDYAEQSKKMADALIAELNKVLP